MASGRQGVKRRRQQLSPLAALAALDRRWSNGLFRAGGSVPRLVWKLFELSGDGLVWLALALGYALAPATPPALRTCWANFLVAWAVDLALVGLLKGAVRRSRPVYNLRSDFTVVVAVDHFSFPSGHSSRVSFVALLAWVLLGRTHPWLGAGVAGWALATALSRAAMGRHYLSDVLAGLLLGVGTIGICTRGQYSVAGLAVSQKQADAAYSLVLSLWRQLAVAAGGATG